MLYTRPQLKLLVALAATLLVGLGVREWRQGFPDMAQRLEAFDREEPPPEAPAPARAERRSAAAGPSAQGSKETSAREAAPAAPATASEAGPLDLNRATAADLARLPGVGPRLAERILVERERRGRFESPESLRDVLGMGPKKLAAIRELVTVGE